MMTPTGIPLLENVVDALCEILAVLHFLVHPPAFGMTGEEIASRDERIIDLADGVYEFARQLQPVHIHLDAELLYLLRCPRTIPIGKRIDLRALDGTARLDLLHDLGDLPDLFRRAEFRYYCVVVGVVWHFSAFAARAAFERPSIFLGVP